MSNFEGPVTIESTGSAVEFSGIGFRPDHLELRVGPKNNSAALVQKCEGFVDEGGYYGCFSEYIDATSSEQKRFDNKVLYHRERVGGTLSTVIEATFHSFTNDGFKLNISQASANYDVWISASN